MSEFRAMVNAFLDLYRRKSTYEERNDAFQKLNMVAAQLDAIVAADGKVPFITWRGAFGLMGCDLERARTEKRRKKVIDRCLPTLDQFVEVAEHLGTNVSPQRNDDGRPTC